MWKQLQDELQDVGVAPEWSDHDHGYIVSTLRNAVEKEGLLEGDQKKTPYTSSRLRQPPLPSRNSLYDTMPPRTPLTLQFQSQEDPETGISDKEVLTMEDFPIPVAMELQGMDDTEKEALPIDDFPIPIATEPLFPGNDDSEKQALPREDFPIPAESEPSVENSHRIKSDIESENSPPGIDIYGVGG